MRIHFYYLQDKSNQLVYNNIIPGSTIISKFLKFLASFPPFSWQFPLWLISKLPEFGLKFPHFDFVYLPSKYDKTEYT